MHVEDHVSLAELKRLARSEKMRSYSSLVPRPQHRKADIEAQATLKKVSRKASKNCPAANRQTLEGLLSG